MHIAKLFKETKDEKYLDLFMYHVASWKNNNAYLVGVNWYSNIEVNLRLINFYYAEKLFDLKYNKNEKVKKFIDEIWMPLIFEHAKFSYEHPSKYSSANNHLIAEFSGLFVASIAWNLKKKYLKYAKSGLEQEILRQNTNDGINKEEAAEYIQFIDDLFLIPYLIGESYCIRFSDDYKNRLHAMAKYLNCILDKNYNYLMYGDGDDGFVLKTGTKNFNNFKSLLATFSAVFNDYTLKRNDAIWDEKCDLLLGCSGKEIFEKLPSFNSKNENLFFKDSGHFIFCKCKQEKEILLHFDAAPLGYLSIAAHGHADALSFILHVDGAPIIVDSGTFTYHTNIEYRKYFVSTIAHNTITINEKNQAEFYPPTMWLKHYKTKILQCSVSENKIVATHNGYDCYGVSHVREIKFNELENEFVITDFLTSTKKFTAEIPFHLHPNCAVNLSENIAYIKTLNVRNIKIILDENLKYSVICGKNDNVSEPKILGFYSEHFGKMQPTNVLYAKKKCQGTVQFITKIKVLDD